jgi:hypothetical protein
MEPHATRIVVWDVPPAVVCGAPFRIKVGVKCAAGCVIAARVVEIRDAAGLCVASAVVGDVPWPGTALFGTEIELRAPDVVALSSFDACVAAVDAAVADRPAHAAASTRFQVRAVPAPECLVKIVAVDGRSHAPVPGAKVVIHPYRALTNAQGIAELRVAKGAYRVFVSGRDRFPFRHDAEVTADVTIEALLDPDLGPSDAELWS